MNRAFKFAFIAAICLPAGGLAATPPVRLRGTIETVSPTSITVLTNDGATNVIDLSSTTHYTTVTKSSLDAILPDDYIGTATKGSGADMVALEVLIFPPSMRGTGDGHYPWDSLPDPSAAKTPTASSMTNGSISSVAMTPAKVSSSMTNGSVQTVSTLPGAKQISVVYKGGKQLIMVPPGTPVVLAHAASHAALTTGAHVFAITLDNDGKYSAILIAVGAKGVTPPM